jgi:CubicO group peptidase (beta-lactamase class C family)
VHVPDSRYSIESEAEARHQSSLLAFAQAAGAVPLAFEPGTQWSYGISTDVLGGVIEKVSGMPFVQFLSERLLGPLRMTDTGFVVPGRNLGRLTTNYEVRPEGLHVVDAPPVLPEGVRASFGLGWGAGGAVILAAYPVPTGMGMTAGLWHRVLGGQGPRALRSFDGPVLTHGGLPAACQLHGSRS